MRWTLGVVAAISAWLGWLTVCPALGFPTIATLIGWLMFGAVLGAASSSRQGELTPRKLALGSIVAVVAVAAFTLVGYRVNAAPATASTTATRTLVTQPAQALPQGTDYFSVLELTQPSGAALGPHAHPYAGFAYSLKGVATLTFTDGRTTRVAPAEVGFIGTQAAHTHVNTDDRLPSAALAVFILAIAAAVCLIALRPAWGAGRLLPAVLILLIAAGVVGTMDPWSNDWVFLSIRGVAQRGGVMPLPTASRVYESADLGTLPGRWVQTLEEITLAPSGGATDIASPGHTLVLVLDGRADVQSPGGPSSTLDAREATLLEPGASARLTNAGNGPARLLRFEITPAPQGG